MFAGPFNDNGNGTEPIEVRIFQDRQLLHRQFVETEEDAGGVAEQWSGFPHVYVLVDDVPLRPGPQDIPAPGEALSIDNDNDDRSIDSAALPGRGTE